MLVLCTEKSFALKILDIFEGLDFLHQKISNEVNKLATIKMDQNMQLTYIDDVA